MDIKFDYETEVSRIIELLKEIESDDEIDDGLKKHTVIMAPDIGGKDKTYAINKRNYKLRVYSHGGRILELTTQRKAKNSYFPNKDYLGKKKDESDYNYKPTKWDDEMMKRVYEKSGALKYEDIKKDDLKKAIEIAKVRGDAIAQERSLETYLVCRNREENNKGIIIDMEFYCPEDWLTECDKRIKSPKYPSSHTGKPDLIVYDSETQSFGLIELKYKNESVKNVDKHFIDFYNIINGKSDEIKKEFVRKLLYLKHYGLINNDIDSKALDKAFLCENNIWVGFLFIDGEEEKSKCIYKGGYTEFKQCKIETEKKYGQKLKTIEYGFCYYKNLEDPVDFSKKAFNFKSF